MFRLPALLLACLPAFICFLVSNQPDFFTVPKNWHKQVSQELHGKSLVLTIICCAMVIPITLFGIISGSTSVLVFLSLSSAIAALWGLFRLAGPRALIVGILLIIVAWLSKTDLALWASNILSIAAGLGAAHFLNSIFSRKALKMFCLTFAGLDIVLVGSGLLSQAINQLPLNGSFIPVAPHLDAFNRIIAGGALLGTGDIAYGALVAALIISAKPTRRQVAGTCFLYAGLGLGMAAFALHTGYAVPATLPGFLALVVLRFTIRRSTLHQEILEPAILLTSDQ